ncbi:hypothetical protein [Enterococcus sp. LJL51]|uniref:hypothetical protein n=1 Tax=Enterococcus sp. LJL51 TaxID=3416656 RepID=UPI003CF7272E
MGKININHSQARSEIQGIQAQISGSLQSAKSSMSQMNGILQESEGAFVDALKQQFQSEEAIVTASEAFFYEVCQSLLNAVDVYEEQDQKLSRSRDQIVS